MNILIVDDHQLFVEGLRLVLDNLPISEQVNIFDSKIPDPMVIHELLEKHDIELVLLDLNFPGADGLDIVKILASEKCLVPIIVLSAEEDINRIKLALSHGSMGFIPKSMNGKEMITAVMQVLDGIKFIPKYIVTEIKNTPDHLPFSKEDLLLKRKKLGISGRQFDTLQMLTSGDSNRDIALRLNVTEHTIKSHLKMLFQILDVRNRTECLIRAKELNLIETI